ncbi:MAG: phosphate signaling complex protein PhoU [Myxococcales bacterium]
MPFPKTLELPAKHTDQEYDAELRKLRENLLRMGAKVQRMIASSVQALAERNDLLARETIGFDRQINRLELDIDEACLRLVARRAPVASDLRFTTTALKFVTDLERIGDLCVHICERVLELNEVPPLVPFVDIPRMADIAQGMVADAMTAFVKGNTDQAEQVIRRDNALDEAFADVFRRLLTLMMEDPKCISRAIRFQNIAKYLERIGDHATNLAERVVFMVRAVDVHTRKSTTSARFRPPSTRGTSLRRRPRGPTCALEALSERADAAPGPAHAVEGSVAQVRASSPSKSERDVRANRFAGSHRHTANTTQ